MICVRDKVRVSQSRRNGIWALTVFARRRLARLLVTFDPFAWSILGFLENVKKS